MQVGWIKGFRSLFFWKSHFIFIFMFKGRSSKYCKRQWLFLFTFYFLTLFFVLPYFLLKFPIIMIKMSLVKACQKLSPTNLKQSKVWIRGYWYLLLNIFVIHQIKVYFSHFILIVLNFYTIECNDCLANNFFKRSKSDVVLENCDNKFTNSEVQQTGWQVVFFVDIYIFFL